MRYTFWPIKKHARLFWNSKIVFWKKDLFVVLFKKPWQNFQVDQIFCLLEKIQSRKLTSKCISPTKTLVSIFLYLRQDEWEATSQTSDSRFFEKVSNEYSESKHISIIKNNGALQIKKPQRIWFKLKILSLFKSKIVEII